MIAMKCYRIFEVTKYSGIIQTYLSTTPYSSEEEAENGLARAIIKDDYLPETIFVILPSYKVL